MECRYCNGAETAKYGHRNSKKGKVQLYRCRSCGRIFCENTAFKKMKFKEEIISVAWDLFYKGLSARKIQAHIKEIHGINVSHTTVLRWIWRYSVFLKKYADDLTSKVRLENSPILHSDEMMLQCGGGMVWNWSVMDSGTKFITASCMSRGRELKDGLEIFKDTKTKLSHAPNTVVTDGYVGYPQIVRKTFFRVPGVKHKRLVKFYEKVSNNPIERYHGSVREVFKNRRGFGAFDRTGAIMDGWGVNYNFMRPHQGLGGITPAMAGGLDLGLPESGKWVAMMNLADRNKIPKNLVERIDDENVKRILRPKTYRYFVKVFDKEGVEITEKLKQKIETEFKDSERSVKFVEFYREVYPYRFEVEKKEILKP